MDLRRCARSLSSSSDAVASIEAKSDLDFDFFVAGFTGRFTDIIGSLFCGIGLDAANDLNRPGHADWPLQWRINYLVGSP